MVSSVSFRRGFVKVRGKKPPRPKNPDVLDENDELIGEEARPSRPLRARPARPLPPPKPWWSHWRAIALGVGIVAVLIGGIYTFARTVRFDDGYGDRRSAAAEAGDMGYPGRASKGFLPGKGTPGETAWGSLSDYSAPTDQSFIDTFGSGRSRRAGSGTPASHPPAAQPPADAPKKIVLDKDAAGNCVLGANLSQDLRDCFMGQSAPSRK